MYDEIGERVESSMGKETEVEVRFPVYDLYASRISWSVYNGHE